MTKANYKHIHEHELRFLINATYEAEFILLKHKQLQTGTAVQLRLFRTFLYWYLYKPVSFLEKLLPTHLNESRPGAYKDTNKKLFFPIEIKYSYLWDNRVDRKNFISITNRLRRSWFIRRGGAVNKETVL